MFHLLQNLFLAGFTWNGNIFFFFFLFTGLVYTCLSAKLCKQQLPMKHGFLSVCKEENRECQPRCKRHIMERGKGSGRTEECCRAFPSSQTPAPIPLMLVMNEIVMSQCCSITWKLFYTGASQTNASVSQLLISVQLLLGRCPSLINHHDN